MKKLATILVAFAAISACSSNEVQPAQPSPSEPARPTSAEVFFVGDTPQGFRLFSETRTIEVEEDSDTDDTFEEEVISDLMSGDLQPLDNDYVNLWDDSHDLNSITITGSTATVDFELGKLNVGAESEARAIEQIVWTLTGINSAITTVQFTVNGQTVESFAGHVDTTVGFTRAPDFEVLNAVQISSITDRAEVMNPVTISGEACTFEANVAWELIREGDVLNSGSTTAAMACPDRSDFDVALGTLDPGTYVLIVQEFSAEDGSLSAFDTKVFTVK